MILPVKQVIEVGLYIIKLKVGIHRCTGLAQVTNWVRLKFAAMNLKKLAKWKWKANNTQFKLLDSIVILIKTKKNPVFA